MPKRERKRKKRKGKRKGKIGDGRWEERYSRCCVKKKIQGRNKNTLSKPLTKKKKMQRSSG